MQKIYQHFSSLTFTNISPHWQNSLTFFKLAEGGAMNKRTDHFAIFAPGKNVSLAFHGHAN